MLKYIRSFVATSFLLVSFFAHAAPVNINTADAATFAESLNGIGPSKAQAIVDYRTENGRFASIDDLVNVQGIGLKTLERIREFLIVTPGASSGTSATVSSSKATLPAAAKKPAASVSQ